MRVVLALIVAAVAAGAVVLLTGRRGPASLSTSTSGPATAVPTAVAPGVPTAPAPPTPPVAPATAAPAHWDPWGQPAMQGVGPRAPLRDRPPFTHLVNGQPVPLEVRQAAGLSDADAAIVARELAAETTEIQTALRGLIDTLPEFEHPPAEVARASALDLLTWVAQYQPLYLQMGEVLSHMSEDEDRMFREREVSWDRFFKADALVMRFARTMHAVRRATVDRLKAAGVDARALDRLRSRYLLDGHFRPEPTRPFDFGRDPGE